MKLPPNVHVMPRVAKDIERCIKFIAQQPWGKPEDRLRDIFRGIDEAAEFPKLNPVAAFRSETGISLRRHYAAQFVIVYTYVEPADLSSGAVSIRAIRHRRVKNVFQGVRDSAAA